MGGPPDVASLRAIYDNAIHLLKKFDKLQTKGAACRNLFNYDRDGKVGGVLFSSRCFSLRLKEYKRSSVTDFESWQSSAPDIDPDTNVDLAK